jgi:hypothetical protein
LPTGEAEQQSLTVGRYQFRKDGVGWECREIIGRGGQRKRSYLAHLSRSVYGKMEAEAVSRADLENKLIAWAQARREDKHASL